MTRASSLTELLRLAFDWPGLCPSLSRLLDRWEVAE